MYFILENSKFGNFTNRHNLTLQDMAQMEESINRIFYLLKNGASAKLNDK